MPDEPTPVIRIPFNWLKRQRWPLFYGACFVVVILLFLAWLGNKDRPPEIVVDSWQHELIVTDLDDDFKPRGWQEIPYDDFSPVKDSFDSRAETLLASKTFLPISEKVARQVSLSKLGAFGNKRAYLVRGVFISYSIGDPKRGFVVFTSKNRIMVQQGGWGRHHIMRRKAVIILIDFSPKVAYCLAGNTV